MGPRRADGRLSRATGDLAVDCRHFRGRADGRLSEPRHEGDGVVKAALVRDAGCLDAGRGSRWRGSSGVCAGQVTRRLLTDWVAGAEERASARVGSPTLTGWVPGRRPAAGFGTPRPDDTDTQCLRVSTPWATPSVSQSRTPWAEGITLREAPLCGFRPPTPGIQRGGR